MTKTMTKDEACQVLCLPRGTEDEGEIKAAFRRLAKHYHTDLGGDREMMEKLLEARAVLEGKSVSGDRMTVTHDGILNVVTC